MKKIWVSAILLGCAVTLAGCIKAPVVPPIGVAFSEFQAPLDIDYDPTQITSKQGMSESMSILGLVAMGDASAKEAARAGGITRIHHADYEYFNVLGVYQRYRTIVYGE